MEYVSHERYEYIMNKYHAQDQPFDAFRRFIRNDALFDEETGLSAEKLRDGILKIGERQEQNSRTPTSAPRFSDA